MEERAGKKKRWQVKKSDVGDNKRRIKTGERKRAPESGWQNDERERVRRG